MIALLFNNHCFVMYLYPNWVINPSLKYQIVYAKLNLNNNKMDLI